MLSGVVASPGSAAGRAVVVSGGVPIGDLTPPYVLVADLTTPDLISVMVRAAGIVTDVGGRTSHAANVARELGIPCIVATGYATLRINPRDWVQVDAYANMVRWTPTGSGCVVCGKDPALHVVKGSAWFAMFDGYPVRRGHLLVVPRRHVGRFLELTPEEADEVPSMLRRSLQHLIASFGADGVNFGVNDGPAAGQTVPHFHIHLVPRRRGDVPDPRGGVRNYLPNPLTEYPTATE